MKFLVLLYSDRKAASPSADAPSGGDVEDWVSEMDKRGLRVAGEPLLPDSAAVSVQVREGARKVISEPHLDTGDSLIGFDLLECRDIEEAIEVAAAHPLARRFVLEIRPAGET